MTLRVTIRVIFMLSMIITAYGCIKTVPSLRGPIMTEFSATQAKYGDACNPTSFLFKDYCERADYPNKNRLFCGTSGETVGYYTCICQFRKKWKYNKNGGASEEFVQLRYNSKTGMCMSPAGGDCDPRFPTGTYEDGDPSKPIYIMNLTKAHEQCDDMESHTFFNKLLCAKDARFSHLDKYGQPRYSCFKMADLIRDDVRNFILTTIFIFYILEVVGLYYGIIQFMNFLMSLLILAVVTIYTFIVTKVKLVELELQVEAVE